ncbi:uncharacterized protein BJ171DRAFT_460621 [Polychytrium aggregatum]|uniref:uncharacterized protein n=1 Tax=Polychytrium aggregatum TaxID=110093 RepID=UPI0022FEBFCE|nr:uncharacterized protein BJ171DRAFT_460621 [Polychytrium aggregatum]KAI9203135.1 hypothetical protein BJ171DRAFT_460621 [Polychytrium aggregatum]
MLPAAVHPSLPPAVRLLILGLGWTGQFVARLAARESLAFAATTTSGRDGTLTHPPGLVWFQKFVFDPKSTDDAAYAGLPRAEFILITFPIHSAEGIHNLVQTYERVHDIKSSLILLGSTSAFAPSPQNPLWLDRHSSLVQPLPDRCLAENRLLELGGCVLNLAGLWGGSRDPRNWVSRVAGDKDKLSMKGSLHLIHGTDVARAVLAAFQSFTPGERWIVSDTRVYDWWHLASAWGSAGSSSPRPEARWALELMQQHGVRALPRNTELLGRALDSREFWTRFGIEPSVALA